MYKKNIAILGTFVLIVILVISISMFPIHQNSVYQVTSQQTGSQGFVLPCTVATYGNAWNGIITFGVNNYLVVMNANGTLLDMRTSSSGGYGVIKNIAQDVLLFQGEPQGGFTASAPTYAEHIWNVASDTTQDFPNVVGHHDCEYDPVNNTFLTLVDYVLQVGNNAYLIDKIVQLDPQGNTLWSWDCYNYLPLSEADPYNLTTSYNGSLVIDFTHANALYWDYNDSIIYLNVRHLNTFYAINQTTGNLLWACGQFGNFTLVDQNGSIVPSLWYHSHDLEPVAPNVFSMFNNDFDNLTNYNSSSSQLLEISLNMQNMTAKTIWSWTAPPQYYSTYLGAAVLLPNGDWIGDFGSPTHQFPENQPWNFTDTGAVLIEVNPEGQIVRTITFPQGWSIYRISLVTNLSQNISFPYPTSLPIPSLTPTQILPPTAFPTPSSSLVPTSPPSRTPTLSQTPTPSLSPTIRPNASTSTQSKSINFSNDLYPAVLIIIVVAAIAVTAFVYSKKGRHH